MKPSRFLFLVIFLFFHSTLFATDQFMVGVAEVAIKDSPKFLAKTVKKFKYGQVVEIVERQGGWVKIRAEKFVGWCHGSAIGSKDSILKDIGKGEKVAKSSTADEVTLAGKGFTETHEEAYRKKNPEANFKDVDKMEQINIDDATLQAFANEGGLNEI